MTTKTATQHRKTLIVYTDRAGWYRSSVTMFTRLSVRLAVPLELAHDGKRSNSQDINVSIRNDATLKQQEPGAVDRTTGTTDGLRVSGSARPIHCGANSFRTRDKTSLAIATANIPSLVSALHAATMTRGKSFPGPFVCRLPCSADHFGQEFISGSRRDKPSLNV